MKAFDACDANENRLQNKNYRSMLWLVSIASFVYWPDLLKLIVAKCFSKDQS